MADILALLIIPILLGSLLIVSVIYSYCYYCISNKIVPINTEIRPIDLEIQTVEL